MSKADDVFMRQFAIVLASLVAFMFIAIFLARAVAGAAEEAEFASVKEAQERIAPVGQVRVGEAPPPPPEPSPEQVAAASADIDGAAVYNSGCGTCHAAGVAGAPKLEAAAWEARVGQGLDTLVSHAINGKGAMPAKGGMANLSDAEIRAAVQYMLESAGVSAE